MHRVVMCSFKLAASGLNWQFKLLPHAKQYTLLINRLLLSTVLPAMIAEARTGRCSSAQQAVQHRMVVS